MHNTQHLVEDRTYLMNDMAYQIITATIVGLIAGIAAYGGAYFRRKGENKALQEDFKEIRRQLQTTTRDTEEIKQQLANHSWLTQQQWSAREQLYTALLGSLHRFEASLLGLLSFYIVPGSEYDRKIEEHQNFRELFKVSNIAITEVENLRGTAALFLSEKAIASLDQLLTNHWHLAKFGSSCTAEYAERAAKLAASTYTEILVEAQAQLGLERRF